MYIMAVLIVFAQQAKSTPLLYGKTSYKKEQKYLWLNKSISFLEMLSSIKQAKIVLKIFHGLGQPQKNFTRNFSQRNKFYSEIYQTTVYTTWYTYDN